MFQARTLLMAIEDEIAWMDREAGLLDRYRADVKAGKESGRLLELGASKREAFFWANGASHAYRAERDRLAALYERFKTNIEK